MNNDEEEDEEVPSLSPQPPLSTTGPPIPPPGIHTTVVKSTQSTSNNSGARYSLRETPQRTARAAGVVSKVSKIKMASKTKRKHSETFIPNEFYRLFFSMRHDIYDKITSREEKFDRIRQWLSSNKDDDNTLKTALTYQDKHHDSPLHCILNKDPPLDILQTFIKYAPEVLQMKDCLGWLPIHVACWNQASLEVIKTLLTASPDSIKAEDNDGWLPLHKVCTNGGHLNVFNLLIKSYPEGLDHEDDEDETPLDFLEHSKYATKMDDNGMLPLHHACKNGYSLHLINFLIEAYRKSFNMKDNDGNTPWQYLAKAASRIDERGMLLLHREAAHCSGLNVKLLPKLFDANPEAIRLQDKWGLLPLHHASLNKASPLEALMSLVKLYPESIAL